MTRSPHSILLQATVAKLELYAGGNCCVNLRLYFHSLAKRQLRLMAAAIRLYQYNGVPGTKASKAAQN